MADDSKKTNRLIKLMIASVAAVLVAAIAFGVVFGYLSGKTGPVKNDLIADVDPTSSIVETVDPSAGVKENVAVSVEADYECYVRATVVVNWVKTGDNGETLIYHEAPVLGTDGDVEFYMNLRPEDEGDKEYWILSGTNDFFYYTAPVKSGATEPLIIECVQRVPAPEGYFLNVRIVSQTIQAAGWTDDGDVLAVVNEWGVTVNNDGYIVAVP